MTAPSTANTQASTTQAVTQAASPAALPPGNLRQRMLAATRRGTNLDPNHTPDPRQPLTGTDTGSGFDGEPGREVDPIEIARAKARERSRRYYARKKAERAAAAAATS